MLWTQSIGEAFNVTADLDRLLYENGIDGPVAEIGVLEGGFFLALQNLTEPGTKSVAIDVFSDTDYQTHSDGIGIGRSIRSVFENNVKLWGRPEDTAIIAEDSFVLDEQRPFPRVKMFSVDGCHCPPHAANDLRIAERSTMPAGLIIVDDYPHPAWPGVAKAVADFLPASKFRPVAVGYNKLWLSQSKYIVVSAQMADVCGYETPLVGWLT